MISHCTHPCIWSGYGPGIYKSWVGAPLAHCWKLISKSTTKWRILSLERNIQRDWMRIRLREEMLGGELVSRCRLTFSTITAKPTQASYHEFGSWQNPKQCSCWWASRSPRRERENFFYLTTHSTHFIYGYMASDIWLRTILIVRKETRCRHIGYSYRLAARVLLYAPSHRQDTPVVEHWLEREIAQWVHPMKDRSDDPSHHERTLYLWATSRSQVPRS